MCSVVFAFLPYQLAYASYPGELQHRSREDYHFIVQEDPNFAS